MHPAYGDYMQRLRKAFEACAPVLAAIDVLNEGVEAVRAGVDERFVAGHFDEEPNMVAVLARAEKRFREYADAIGTYRRAIIRAHGGPAPSVNADGGAKDDGEDRT